MMLKTLAIMLSLSVAYSSATYAMEENDPLTRSQKLGADYAKKREAINQTYAEAQAIKQKSEEARFKSLAAVEASNQAWKKHEKDQAMNQKVEDESLELLAAAGNGTMSIEDVMRAFEMQEKKNAERKAIRKNN